jgi:hypothetical protein
MLLNFIDRLMSVLLPHRRPVPSWAHLPDPRLPRLRPSYRWWVHW